MVAELPGGMTTPTVGERIKRLRRGVLLTQDDLAAAAGVSTDLIRKLEQGRRHTASIGSLHRIAAALDVDLGELLGRDSPFGDPRTAHRRAEALHAAARTSEAYWSPPLGQAVLALVR